MRNKHWNPSNSEKAQENYIIALLCHIVANGDLTYYRLSNLCLARWRIHSPKSIQERPSCSNYPLICKAYAISYLSTRTPLLIEPWYLYSAVKRIQHPSVHSWMLHPHHFISSYSTIPHLLVQFPSGWKRQRDTSSCITFVFISLCIALLNEELY